jgi:hypothetical protein
MKITIPENLNTIEAIRRAGYGQVMDRRATEQSWSRRLGDGIYPRFHVYINGQVINLHLDQKQASYEGYGAHSGEYSGPTVETEAQRIIESMNKLLAEKLEAVEAPKQPEKAGFWGKLFGN